MKAQTQDPLLDLSQFRWPVYAEDEVEAACQVLQSGKVNYWTGSEGREFESAFAGHFGLRRAVAMANGTVTLQACLRSLGVGPGDEVVTTPRTFVGTSSAIVQEGAIPIFADVSKESGNLDPTSIEAQITSKTKAILLVHLAGWPCEMDEILDVARRYRLDVIEDCAQSHGAMYRDKHTGSFGRINSWSFCQDKIMSTGGEGGMVATNDEELWSRAWSYKDHGKSFEAMHATNQKPGFRWVHEGWGTNWRMTEIQSVIGRIQLGKLPTWTSIRTRNARILEEALRPLDALRVPTVPSHIRHAYYKMYAYIRPEALKLGWTRDRVLERMAAAGVPGLTGSCPEIYREQAFIRAGLVPNERLPVAMELGETSMMFAVHPTLPESVIHNVADVVADCVRAATR